MEIPTLVFQMKTYFNKNPLIQIKLMMTLTL